MYKNGKKEGDSTQYFTNGLVNKKEIYKNDILHGVSEWYFDANDMAHYTKELYYRGNLIVARSCQNGKTRQNDIGRMNLCKREEELGKIMKELLSPESFKVLVRNSTIRKITDFDTGLSEITEMLIEADMEF
jgi:antitoxin component YwqK of YwqJK toxin-antitoxin module